MDNLKAQWAASRRLRIAVGIALVVAAAHLALGRADALRPAVEGYRSDAELFVRLEEASREAAWPERAEQAALALEGAEAAFERVETGGEAQAELQARLSQIAAEAGLPQARVRTESAAPMDQPAGVLEVIARVDAQGAAAAIDRLVIALASPPWLKVERLDIVDGEPASVIIVMRGYFLEGATGAETAP